VPDDDKAARAFAPAVHAASMEEAEGGEGGEAGAVAASPLTGVLSMEAQLLVARELAAKGDRAMAATLEEAARRLRAREDEPDPKRRLAAVVALLDQARKEYGDAIAEGRIKEPLEYHDSRGLYLIARQAFEQVADALRPQGPAIVAAIAGELDRLAPVWPAIERPAAPVASPGEVSAAIARIELSAGRLTRAP
jgi:hypothetical protein